MGLTSAQRHNRMMGRVFDGYHERLVTMYIREVIANNELDDFSKFVNANPKLTVIDAFEMFKAVGRTPF